MFKHGRMRALAIGAVLALLLVGCRDITNITSSQVSSDDASAWSTFETGGGTAEFVAGSFDARPPAGIGSLQLQTQDGDIAGVGTGSYAGKRLAEISALAYSARTAGEAAPRFVLHVTNGEGVDVLESVAPEPFAVRYNPYAGPTDPCMIVACGVMPMDLVVAAGVADDAGDPIAAVLDDPRVHDGLRAAAEEPATAAALVAAMEDDRYRDLVAAAQEHAEVAPLLAAVREAADSDGLRAASLELLELEEDGGEVAPIAASWVAWDAVGGTWRLSEAETTTTLAEYLAGNPDAVIADTADGGIQMLAGPQVTDAQVDNVQIGVGLTSEPMPDGSTNEHVQADGYDFEPATDVVTVTPSSARKAGWSFSADGDGARAVISRGALDGPAALLGTGDGTGTAQIGSTALDGAAVAALHELSFDTFSAALPVDDEDVTATEANPDAGPALAPTMILTLDTDHDGVADVELRTTPADVIRGETQTRDAMAAEWVSPAGGIFRLHDVALASAVVVSSPAGPGLRIVAGELAWDAPVELSAAVAVPDPPAPLWADWSGWVDNVTVAAHADPSSRLRFDFQPNPSGGSSAPAPTTSQTGDAATAQDPVHVAVTSPAGGVVTTRLRAVSTDAEGFQMFGQELVIEAPAATAERPLQFAFRVHSSLLSEGQVPADVIVFRDGVPVADCTDPASGHASPDPCVAGREVVGDEIVVDVLSSHASVWNLGALVAPAGICNQDVPAAGYSDVPQASTHRRSIDCATAVGITAGLGDGSFGPGVSVTRGQMATFVVNALAAGGVTLPSPTDQGFRDLGDSPHAANIDRAAAAGVTQGLSGLRFSPDTVVTRGQMATFLANTAAVLSGASLAATQDWFADDDGHTHEASINSVREVAIATGVAADRFAPDTAVRRGQMATFLVNLLMQAE